MVVPVVLLIAVASALVRAAPAPSTAPASPASPASAATRPQDMEPLIDGSLRYLPPAGWKQISKSDDNLRVSFVSPDGFGRIDLTVTPQTRDVEEAQAGQMAMIIGKNIRESAKAKNRELLLQPRVEKDPRFFLIVHDRMRGAPDKNTGTADERINDRMQLYRALGLNLVHVASTAFVTNEQEGDAIHETAKKLLADMRLVRGVAPAVFPKSNLKITPPVDWKTTKVDQANGAVATYTSPESADRQILVRCRVLPKDAREDAAKRDALLDRMVDDERRTIPFSAGVKPGEEQVVGGGEKVLRQLQTTLDRAGGQKLKVTTRYLVVGDVLVSVRSVAEESDESTAKLADALVATIKPIR
jgi:hypothetical protein